MLVNAETLLLGYYNYIHYPQTNSQKRPFNLRVLFLHLFNWYIYKATTNNEKKYLLL